MIKNLKNSPKIKFITLTVIIICLSLNVIPTNFNDNSVSLEEIDKTNFETDLNIKELKSQDLSSDNIYEGIGSPWNVSHWVNRTDYDLPVSFGNGSYDTVNMDLGSGWEGYQLNGTIKNLYDTRNWVNGTFHEGADDGYTYEDDVDIDDSSDVLNWTFGSYDNTSNLNDMSGNYFNGSAGDPVTNEDYLELQIMKSGNKFDINDRCWWNSSFKIPRGKVFSGDLFLSVYPDTVDNLANTFNLEIYINDEFVYGIGLYTIQLMAGGQNWVDLIISLENFLDNSKIFPNPINNSNMNITVQLKTLTTVPASMGQNMGDYERIYIDNVSLFVKAEAKPEQIGLEMNDQPISNIDWGNGTVGQISTWTMTPVAVKFNSSEVRPPEMGGYDIEFKTDLNLYAKKMSTDSHYQPNFPGTTFEVKNDSIVEWQSYARVSVPTSYEETNITIRFPTDVNITWISNAEFPNNNILKYCDNSTQGILKVYNFSETPDGFWWVKGESPNYCSELNTYNGPTATGPWDLNNTFISGDYINITGKIEGSGLVDISGYIENTKAKLHIRFPNGTIWAAKNQIKQVDTTGIVYFDPIWIPNDGTLDYEVGIYEAIITWNNSYSNFNVNETGIIYKIFTVNHNSSLIPDQNYYSDIFVGDIVNLKVSFIDPKNIKPIENAIVYAKNFSGDTQYFNEINPGYYFLEFNTTDGSSGDQNLTIYATHPLYKDNKVNVTIGLIEYTILTAVEYPSIKVPWNNNFTIHLSYTNTSGSGIGAATTTVTWNDEKSIDAANGIYNLTCNTSLYQVNNAHNLKIDLNKTGYESQTIIISIEVVERETYIDEIFINDDNCTVNKFYNIYSGELMNITVKYKDTEKSGAFIPNATVTLNGTGVGEIFTDNNVYNFYNLTLNSTKLSVGISFLNIIAQKNNYTAITELLTINVYETETDYWLYLNGTIQGAYPSIQLYDNQLLNITLTYNDTILKEHISGATIDINGSDISANFVESFNNYSVLINTMYLNQGVNFLTIFARKDGHEAHSILLIIEIIQIETNLTLFLDGEDKTTDPSIQLYDNQLLNITISYNDSIDVEHIPNAIVDINGSGISKILVESFNNYSVVINTTKLNQGVNFLSIYARRNNYEPQTIVLIIEIIQIETNLTLFLDGEDKTADPSIQLYDNQLLNITISYNRSVPVEHIPNAIVDINGSGISKILVESFNNYSVLINTTKLNQGVNFLSIYARRNNYEPQTILLIIEIIQIETDFTLFLDGNPKNGGDTIQVDIAKTNINVTVYYRENITELHINNATVKFLGGNSLIETNNQYYSLIISASDLNQGINIFTVSAQLLPNFEPQTIQFFIELIERGTELLLSLNGVQKSVGDTIIVEMGQVIDVVVNYRDGLTDYPLPNAIVNLVGFGRLNELVNQYSTTISTLDLEEGITVLTIIAQVTNYQTQSIQFFVEVIKKSARLYLFLNNINTTLDPVYNLTIGKNLNITVKYTDYQTNQSINNATIQLIGEGLSLNLTRDDTLGQHYILLDTTTLGIGVKLFTVVAQSTNFQIKNLNLRVTVRKINTEITPVSGSNIINIDSGGDAFLRVSLNDTDFDNLITNATVKYTWAFGTGDLNDPDNDGIYTAVLSNVAEGSYSVIITAFLNENYHFESYEIIVAAIIVAEDSTLFQTLSIVSITAAVGLTIFLISYTTFLKFPKQVRKVRKYRRSLKKKGNPSTHITTSKDAFNSLYKEELKQISNALKGKPSGITPKSKLLESSLDTEQLMPESLEKKAELDKIIDKSSQNKPKQKNP